MDFVGFHSLKESAALLSVLVGYADVKLFDQLDDWYVL